MCQESFKVKELGTESKNQNGNLRWHLPLGVRPPPYSGRKSLILAPQDIPDISGLGFGCQCVKAYGTENPVTNQKIL